MGDHLREFLTRWLPTIAQVAGAVAVIVGLGFWWEWPPAVVLAGLVSAGWGVLMTIGDQ